MENCSRCNEKLLGWYNQWPNYGRIELGVSSQMSEKIKIPFDHSLVKEYSAQSRTIQWGAGYKYPQSEFRLCDNCQIELVKLIGEFFTTKK